MTVFRIRVKMHQSKMYMCLKITKSFLYLSPDAFPLCPRFLGEYSGVFRCLDLLKLLFN